MEYTQYEVLDALEESGRSNWTIRQMTALRSKGLLPKLSDKRKPGTNSARYVWTEEDLEQIVTVYDLLEECGGSHERVALVLWIKGYSIPLDLLRQTFLRPVENYFQRLTQGETDAEEISMVVSSIALMFMNKLRFAPSFTEQRKKIDMEQMRLITQILLDILSDLDPDPEMLNSLFFSDDEEIFARTQRMIDVVRDILALPHLREAINTTAPEQWQKVRENCLSFYDVLGIIEARRPKNGEAPFPEVFLMGLKITGALWFTAPLLSMHYRGYGQWIDLAFEKIHEFLADPAIQEQILNRQMARRAIEADIQDNEKPDLLLSE